MGARLAGVHVEAPDGTRMGVGALSPVAHDRSRSLTQDSTQSAAWSGSSRPTSVGPMDSPIYSRWHRLCVSRRPCSAGFSRRILSGRIDHEWKHRSVLETLEEALAKTASRKSQHGISSQFHRRAFTMFPAQQLNQSSMVSKDLADNVLSSSGSGGKREIQESICTPTTTSRTRGKGSDASRLLQSPAGRTRPRRQ